MYLRRMVRGLGPTMAELLSDDVVNFPILAQEVQRMVRISLGEQRCQTEPFTVETPQLFGASFLI